MKKIIYIFAMLAALSLGTACESYLDRQPDDQLTSDSIFEKKNTTEKYLVNVYSFMPDVANLRGQSFCYNLFSDLVTAPYNGYGELFGSILHNNFNATSASGHYTGLYQGIREATYFMKNLQRCPELTEAEIIKWRAEARFLRAFYYTELLRLFGPVFLIGDELADFNNPNLTEYDRTSWDKCVEWVCNEYDLAAAELPKDPFSNLSEYGRATQGAALAMKARLLVYNARPLFNGQNGSSMYKNVKNRFGEPLFSTEYDANKWKLAADACKAVIELNKYSLNYDDTDPSDPLKNINSIYNKMDSREFIFARQTGAYNTRVTSTPQAHGGTGTGYGGLAPTQKLVDAFAMENGRYPVTNIDTPEYNNGLNPEFDSASGYNEEGYQDFVHPFFQRLLAEPVQTVLPAMNMFVGREPRFYANVFWSGLTWGQHDGTQVKENIEFHEGGNNAGSVSNNYPPTGYLSLKWMSPKNSPSNNYGGSVSWPIIRYADILLMYAEALNEIDPTNADILTYWNMVRERAGVPNIETVYTGLAGNKELQRKYIRQERMVELCIEGVRHFDMRTWMTADYDCHGEVVGCNIMVNNDNVGGEYWKRTSVFDCRGEGGFKTRRTFTMKNYLFPIPDEEIKRVPGMTQNPGW